MSNIKKSLPAARSLRRTTIGVACWWKRASDVIFTLDLDGNFTSVNPAGERLSGCIRQEALALNLADVVSPEHLGLAREMIRRKVMGEVASTRHSLAILTKDGRSGRA